MFGFGSTGVDQAELLALLGLPSPVGVVAWGKTPTVDFLAAVNTTYDFDLPVFAGKTFVAMVALVVFDTITGVAVGNATVSYGNAPGPAGVADANAVNSNNISAAAINAGALVTPYRVVVSGNAGPLPIMTTLPLHLRIQGNPTGVTVLNGRAFLAGVYV